MNFLLLNSTWLQLNYLVWKLPDTEYYTENYQNYCSKLSELYLGTFKRALTRKIQ